MAKTPITDKQKVVTPEFRVSFPHLFKAQAMPGTANKPKYSITMLFEKDSDLTEIKKAIFAAKKARFGPNKDEWPEVPSAFGDGDGKAGLDKTKKRREGYAGHWVLKASSNEENQPGLVNTENQPIIKASDFYAGCYARAAITAYVWEFPEGSGKYGVGFILDHVQKLRDGKSFSGKKAASEVFGPLASDSTEENFDDEESFA